MREGERYFRLAGGGRGWGEVGGEIKISPAGLFTCGESRLGAGGQLCAGVIGPS